jgi:membrane protease YdiL (CAAX protease family)
MNVFASACLVAAGMGLMRMMGHAFKGNPDKWKGWYLKSLSTRVAPLMVVMLGMTIRPSWLPLSLFTPGIFMYFTLVLVSGLVLLDAMVRTARFGTTLLVREYRYGAFTLISLSFLGAFSEEALFRGLLLSSLMESLPAPAAIGIQALAFALLHYKGGTPSGWRGVGFTLMLGAGLGLWVTLTKDIIGAAVLHGLALPYLIRLKRALCEIKAARGKPVSIP